MTLTRERIKAKALLIDLDGTIVDITEPCHAAAKEAAIKLQLEDIDPEIGVEIAKKLQISNSIDEAVHKLARRRKVGKSFVKAFLDSWYALAPRRTRVMPQVAETLEAISRHYSLALITRRNMPKKPIIKELKRLGIAPFFKVIVTSQDVDQPKPSPQAYEKAASKLGVSVQDCAVVGDSTTDIKAGKSAGAKTIAVLSGLFSRKELEKLEPDLIIRDINALPDFLQQAEINT
jgi:HAD superfamily hydrolase (TIGR01509 family)